VSLLLLEGAQLAQDAAQIATAFADNRAHSMTSSGTIAMMMARLDKIPPGKWTRQDAAWVGLAAQGLVGIAGSHLHGIARTLADDDPLWLHPFMTLARGVAEAAGQIFWLAEPFLDGMAPNSTNVFCGQDEWDRRASLTLARSQCSYLEGLAQRRNRYAKFYGPDSTQYTAANAAIDQYKDDLRKIHDAEDLVLTRGKGAWSIRDQSIPSTSSLVTSVTEYAFGHNQPFRGVDLYPLYSGYAHASLELLLSNYDPTHPTSDLLLAGP
jgi:hypothetical protein